MAEIRRLFVSEHFKQIGFVDGLKWVRRSNGNIVEYETILHFIQTGEV